MNNCEDKIKASCPPNSPFANCVKSEITPPEFSGLTNSCNSVDDVLGDLYEVAESIKEEIDLTTVTSECDTLPTVKTVITVIQYLVDNICTQKTQIDALIAQNATQAAEILALQSNICN